MGILRFFVSLSYLEALWLGIKKADCIEQSAWMETTKELLEGNPASGAEF
jgi:hypothetical protein